MIQYQYFHTSSGYVPRLSIGKDSPNFYCNEELFERIRKSTPGNSFTYGTLGTTEFVFVQANQNNNEVFVKGVLCNNISELPAKYIDKFETSVADSDRTAEVLPEATMPQLGRRVEDLSIAQNLHHIFPKLIDAIVYGEHQKQILIITPDRETAVNYIKVASLLLPMSYVKKIGFCVGMTTVHNEKIAVSDSNGNYKELSIKILAPQLSNFDFDTYAPFYYVFDTVSDRDNYDRKLSVLAQVVDEINLCEKTRVEQFIARITKAFDTNGNINKDELERLATMYLFELKRDVPSAKNILTIGVGTDEVQESAFVNAANVLLDPRNDKQITPAERGVIVHQYTSNENVAKNIEGSLFRHLSISHKTLSAEEKAVLLNMIAKDDSGERLNDVLAGSLRGDYQAMVDAFTLSMNVLEIALCAHDWVISDVQKFIRRTAQFFDISNCYRRIPTNQIANGESIFTPIIYLENSQIKEYAVALLMSSAYFTGTPVECCEMRIKGFKRMLAESSLTSLEKVELILSARNKMLDFTEEVENLEIEEQFDFLLNCEFGNLWMNELVNSFAIEDVIKSDELIKARTSDRKFYESFATIIRDRLLNIEYIRRNIRSGYPVLDQYKQFFELLPVDLQGADIKQYLSELDHESDVSTQYSDYRCGFAFDCFATLSEVNRQKILRQSGEVSSFDALPEESKTAVVENTIKVFGTTSKQGKKNKGFTRPFAIWAFCLSVLSGLLLVIPAVIQAATLGSFDFTLIVERTIEFIRPEYMLIPLYVYLLNIFTYCLLKDGNKLKRANIITLLCGILPVVIFDISYLVFYYLGLNIDIPFLQQMIK